MTINECKIKNQYTEKQIKLKDCLRKKFGDIKQATLDYKLILLKHDLKAKSEKIKHCRNQWLKLISYSKEHLEEHVALLHTAEQHCKPQSMSGNWGWCFQKKFSADAYKIEGN